MDQLRNTMYLSNLTPPIERTEIHFPANDFLKCKPIWKKYKLHNTPKNGQVEL